MSLSEARKTIRAVVGKESFIFPINHESRPYPPTLLGTLTPLHFPEFTFLKEIGFSPQLKTVFNNTPSYDTHCPFWDSFVATNPEFSSYSALAEYRKVSRSKENFLKSIKKCDVKRIRPDDSDPIYKLALEYTYRMMGLAMTGVKPVSTVDFQPDTSPGYPWTRLGCKDKLAATMHPAFPEYMANHYLPIWTAIDKNEFLPSEDVETGKVRTIFSPPTDFILKQKVFSSPFNDRMMKHSEDFDTFWPRYGFVKQYGGFNRLMNHHSQFDLHFTSDGSGWDRVFSLMEPVWEQKRRFLFGDEPSPPLFDYVAENVRSSYIALPDGRLIQADDIGNRSGSDSTTVDNCWGHVMMTFYLCLSIGRDRLQRILSYEEIVKHTAFSLYGDDNLGSLDSKFFKLDLATLKQHVLAAYAAFGVIVKTTQFNTVEGHDLTSLEFLGNTAKRLNGHYYPMPRLGKLWTSLTRVLDTKDPDPIASCIGAVFDLVSFTGQDPDCERLRSLLIKYATFLLNEPSFICSGPSRDQLARVAADRRDFHLHYGWESGL